MFFHFGLNEPALLDRPAEGNHQFEVLEAHVVADFFHRAHSRAKPRW